MNIEAKIETPTTVRERVSAAFGFDEPSALDLVDRSSFANEDAFWDAAVTAEMERSNPEYRAIRSRLKNELRERTEREQREKQSQVYSTIRAGVALDDLDKRNIDQQAAELARRDLAAGRISASALGATIEQYARDLSEKKKDSKAANQLFNSMLRGEL